MAAVLASTVGGALVARPVPAAAVAAAFAAVALLGVALRAAVPARPECGRRVAVVGSWCVAALVLASMLGARALAGLDEVPEGRVAGIATLAGDPRAQGDEVRVEARLGGRRVELRASGATGRFLGGHDAGEGVEVIGWQRPAPAAAWYQARHLAARVAVWRAGPGPRAALPWRAANALRSTLARGTRSLDADQRALFDGLVTGDDRNQRAATVDDFRGSGLTHLLAVSGQNVAFVLAVASPVLRRSRLWPRLLWTLCLLILFGLVTRLEPSVLRAAAMAAVATVGATVGRPAARCRVLTIALTGLLLVDPMLARSTGFQLSAAASAAILVGAGPLERVLPGPAPLRAAIAVTVAAQLGVAPLLVASFGPVPAASLPANLLAGPVAGFVMGWGLVAGVAAGLVEGPAPWLAPLLHLPTSAALAWVAGVAHRFALAPLGMLGPVALAAIAVGLGAAVVGRPLRHPRLGGAFAAAVLASTAVAAQAPAPLRATPAPGLTVWRSEGATLVVVDVATAGRSPTAPSTLDALRRAGVRRVDVVVVARDVALTAADAVVERYGVTQRIGPAGPTGSVRLGGLDLAVVDAGERLLVEAGDPLRYRSPPHVRAVAPDPGRGSLPRAAPRSPPLRHHAPGTGDGDPQPHAGLVLRPG